MATNKFHDQHGHFKCKRTKYIRKWRCNKEDFFHLYVPCTVPFLWIRLRDVIFRIGYFAFSSKGISEWTDVNKLSQTKSWMATTGKFTIQAIICNLRRSNTVLCTCVFQISLLAKHGSSISMEVSLHRPRAHIKLSVSLIIYIFYYMSPWIFLMKKVIHFIH